MTKPKRIELTYPRAVAIMKAADIIWSEMEIQVNDSDWCSLIDEVKRHFPELTQKYSYL